MKLLQIDGLVKTFGDYLAINRIDLSISKGELSAIIGSNGAGKTTLFNLITGLLQPNAGRIFFKQENITNLPPYKIVQKGICRAFQLVNIFSTMTVFENIRMGVLSAKNMSSNWFSNISHLNEVNEEAFLILGRVGLNEFKDAIASRIPHGLQKALEIGIALSRKADLLLLDEPTSGMNPEETAVLMSQIRTIWEKNEISIVLVEHDMDVVFKLAKRVIVMWEGRIIADGDPSEIKETKIVKEVYLGTQNTGAQPR